MISAGISLFVMLKVSGNRKDYALNLIIEADKMTDIGENNKALIILQQAKKHYPNQASLEYRIGCIQNRLNNPLEAIKSFSRASKIGYEFPELLNLELSKSYLALNDIKNAKISLSLIEKSLLHSESLKEYTAIHERLFR